MKKSSALVCALVALSAGVSTAQDMQIAESTPSLLSAFNTGNAGFSLASAPPSLDVDPPLLALATYERAGWQAVLSTRAHGVAGTVTIVDADTFRVDNFFYDGGGIAVHFILAAADDNTTFRTARLVTEPNFLGMPQSGSSVTVDLPAGTTFAGRNAISLWCVPAQANFGSGTFVPTPEPNTTMIVALGAATLAGTVRRRQK